MDGKTLTRMLAEVLNEDPDTSAFAAAGTGGYSKHLYDYLNQAAHEFNLRTKMLHDSQDLTTVADEDEYTLDADFDGLYAMDSQGRYFCHYINSSSVKTPIYLKEEGVSLWEDNTTSVAVPSYFYVKDKILTTTTRTGSATASGNVSGGQCTLTATGCTFTTWDVQAGDTIHNTTDGSYGVVLSVSSQTALVTALFDGTNNDWTSADAFTIVHQPRLKLVTTEPCSTASETVRAYFLQRPAPVYSHYGRFRFPSQYAQAIVKYAAWLMKYRDKDPNTGDRWYQYWDRAVRAAGQASRGTVNRRGFKVIMKKA